MKNHRSNGRYISREPKTQKPRFSSPIGIQPSTEKNRKPIDVTSELHKKFKMKLIYFSVAITLFCMGSFAAPTTRVEGQMCTCTRELAYESELRTGLQIWGETIVIIILLSPLLVIDN